MFCHVKHDTSEKKRQVGFSMWNPKWTEYLSREFLILFMGLFIVLAIVESNKFYVVLREPSEFSVLAFYYFMVYFPVLCFRIIISLISKYLKSAHHQKAFSFLKAGIPMGFTNIRSQVNKMSKKLRPLYALSKIRFLF